MPRYQFPGYPAFLDAAAAEIGHPEAAGPARRDATLAAIATLCGQATEAEPRHVAGILARARELGHQLQAAHRAAELMVAEVLAGRADPTPPAEPARRTRSNSSPIESRGVNRSHG
ncbi:MAG: hypothetical protein JWN86_2025 [Planctomycetota bacterium]|nr:hypothetical protein [Planctomycetota bacterium]